MGAQMVPPFRVRGNRPPMVVSAVSTIGVSRISAAFCSALIQRLPPLPQLVDIIHQDDGVIDHDTNQAGESHKSGKRKGISGDQQGPDHPGKSKGDGHENNEGLFDRFELQHQHGQDGYDGNQDGIGHTAKGIGTAFQFPADGILIPCRHGILFQPSRMGSITSSRV